MSRGSALLLSLLLAASLAATKAGGFEVAVLGDSYASGEGLADANAPCGRSTGSWGVTAGEAIGDAIGRNATVRLLACSGAEVDDVMVTGPQGREAQVIEAAGPVDLLLLTAGGNDLGFVDIVADCLGFADLAGPADAAALDGSTWSSLLEGSTPDLGCDVSDTELLARVTSLVDAGRFQLSPDGSTGGLAEVYAQLARDLVVDGGTLAVVGYPELVAPSSAWPERYGRRCHALMADDADALGAVVRALDDLVADEVDRANDLLGHDGVVHVSLLDAAVGDVDDDHRLCGGGDPWINGLSVTEGGVDVARLLVELSANGGELDLEAIGARPGGSFHPSTAGHAGIAAIVADTLTDRMS